MHRRGLGRGLDALLGSPPPSAAAEQASTMTHEEASSEIALDLIEVNPRQPRKTFDPVTLDELARSIKTSGVIQPIVVRKAPSGAGWQLVAGERRWRAARMAGLEKIPAVVREVTDAESLELALVENLLDDNGDLFPRVLAFSPGFVPPGRPSGRPEVFITHGDADPILPFAATSRWTQSLMSTSRRLYLVFLLQLSGPSAR